MRRVPGLAAAAVGLLTAAGLLLSGGVGSMTDPAEIYRTVSDAFFVPAVFLLCLGLLELIARDGFFDLFGYACRSVITLFTPFRPPEKAESYLAYCQARRARRSEKPRPVFLLPGLGFLLIAGVSLLLYFSVTG